MKSVSYAAIALSLMAIVVSGIALLRGSEDPRFQQLLEEHEKLKKATVDQGIQENEMWALMIKRVNEVEQKITADK